MDLSIIIPTLNESEKISADIKAAAEFLQTNNFTGEIIVSDDGSTDNTPTTAQNTPVPDNIQLKVLTSEKHKGKGSAVRTAVLASTGQYVMFADSGLCTPYSYALTGLKLIEEQNCSIAHGSRKLPQSNIKKPQSLYRRLCSALFHRFLTCYMKTPADLTDTQCGFKIYSGDVARDLYSKCKTSGFMFDIQIITLAQKQNLKIKEFPIEWTCDRDSRLSPTRSLFHILVELKAINKTL